MFIRPAWPQVFATTAAAGALADAPMPDAEEVLPKPVTWISQ
jgi:hypothetical protein